MSSHNMIFLNDFIRKKKHLNDHILVHSHHLSRQKPNHLQFRKTKLRAGAQQRKTTETQPATQEKTLNFVQCQKGKLQLE